MMRLTIPIALASILAGLSAGRSEAALVVFSAVDAGAGPGDSRPNSDAAASSFDAAAGLLGPLSTIDFESAPVGSFHNLTVAPGVSIDGIDGGGGFQDQTILDAPFSSVPGIAPLIGFNTTVGGAQFINVNGGDLTFTFANPVQAFGAYLTGTQPFPLNGLPFTERIRFSDGTLRSVDVPSSPNFDGGVSFIGFTSAGHAISSITITVGNDAVGVDDVRFVLAGPTAVPEPSTLASAGLAGAIGLVGALRRRRSMDRRG